MSGATKDKIFELRTYSIKPDRLKEFLTLTNEKFHLRTRASVLHGYWTVELGGINQVPRGPLGQRASPPISECYKSLTGLNLQVCIYRAIFKSNVATRIAKFIMLMLDS